MKSKLLSVKNNLQDKNKIQSKEELKVRFWLDEWLSISKTRVKESTYIKYFNSINNYIKPVLGNMNICNLSTTVIEEFVYKKLSIGKLNSNQGLSPKSVSEILIIIKDTVKYAQSEGLKIHCQFERISIKKKTDEMRVLSLEEETKLIKSLITEIDRYKLGILICLFTGIRIGERCALKWCNISFVDKTLKINSTLQRLQYLTPNKISKTHIVITEPKSEAANRIIPIQDSLLNIILKFKAKDDSYILTGPSDKFVEPRVMQQKFK